MHCLLDKLNGADEWQAGKGYAPLWPAVGAQAVEILEDSSLFVLLPSPRAQLAVAPAPQRHIVVDTCVSLAA